MHERESTARHSSTAKTMKMKPLKKWKEKKTFPSRNNFLSDWNTSTGVTKKQKNSRASLAASYAARPSRDHLATDSVRVELSPLSATVSPVARLACSPVLTVAVVRQLDNVGAQTA